MGEERKDRELTMNRISDNIRDTLSLTMSELGIHHSSLRDKADLNRFDAVVV